MRKHATNASFCATSEQPGTRPGLWRGNRKTEQERKMVVGCGEREGAPGEEREASGKGPRWRQAAGLCPSSRASSHASCLNSSHQLLSSSHRGPEGHRMNKTGTVLFSRVPGRARWKWSRAEARGGDGGPTRMSCLGHGCCGPFPIPPHPHPSSTQSVCSHPPPPA